MNRPSDITIMAQTVSRGYAAGIAVCLYGRRRQFYKRKLKNGQEDKELRRFRASIRLAGRQLGDLSKNGLIESASGILDFHRMILADESLLASIEKKIVNDKVNAEWAVKVVTDSYAAKYKSLPDERFRERHLDLDDITERILTALGGGRRPSQSLPEGSIIVSRELNPSTLVELSRNQPAGIITEHGGWTSHTFILARELGIPSVTGVPNAVRRISNGDKVIIDGYRGEVIVRPTESTTLGRGTADRRRAIDVETTAKDLSDIETLDHRKIVIRANADLAGGYEKARSAGARGIGLFRSEYIFNRYRGIPPENEQYELYRSIAELAGNDGVRIRTFDFGADDLLEQGPRKSKNPALGLRAIRLSLDREKLFRVQLRALLRASAGTNVDIVLPMVSDVAEVRKTKDLLEQERAALLKRGIDSGNPRLGVMIEVPSTVLMIDEILEESDLLCLGTNDLVQYLLAVDRDNESVAAWFRTLSPAVIRAIRTVLESAGKKDVPCVVCGEMAGSPFYVPVLVGLGAVELSMNPNSVARIRTLISGIAFEETRRLVRQIEKCYTAAEVEEASQKFIQDHWAHLFSTASV